MTIGNASRRGARTWSRVVLVSGLAVGLVSACSSSHKAAGGGGSTASTSTGGGGGPTGSELLIGVVSSDTGAAGNSTQVPTTVKIWQNWVNGHGGVAGHPVKVLEQDDKNDPAQSATIVSGYLNQHVLAIVDDSTVDQTWAKDIAAANVPVICAASTGNGFTCNSNANFIPTGTTVIAGVYGQAKAAQVAGATNLGILYAGEVAAAAQAVPLQKNFAAQSGLKFGYAGVISATAPNYTAQCLAAKSAGVDALFPEEVATRIAQDCASQDYHPKYVQAQGAVFGAFKNNPLFEGSVGVIGIAPWWAATSPGIKEFQQAFSKYGPELDTFTSPYTVMETWDALQLFAAAAAKVPASPAASDIVTGIYALPAGFTLDGLLPPETLVQGKPHSNPCFFVLGIKSKHYALPYGDKPFCQPGVNPS